ncbi:hypothetical protein GCM10023340_30400 [Nocardioides marinquilinus]|uniref:Transcriptional regulator, AbiEi antitoxin, Type IV TA system n=1 Tax=Nocardioides marinquilinus TaxID=1210400 RepID=A0ABP9PSU0_9ACTN
MARPTTYRQLLEIRDGLPRDRPFTASESDALGVPNRLRRLLLGAGLLRRAVPGVFHAPELKDSLDLRLQMLRLVVPADCVVTDRTAAWLWGAQMVLAPGDHLQVPRISVFAPPGRRLRNGLSASGERQLADVDVAEVSGLQVTTPLRSACDLARLLHRDQAIGTMDALARLGTFSVDRLVLELDRFKGYRGVIQARMLAPLVDARAESPMESVTRLRWHDAGLPWPECQVEVAGPDGPYFVDVGRREERFGVEYFGEEFHGETEAEHDADRLDWLRGRRQWHIVVAGRADVIGPRQSLDLVLRLEWHAHGRPVRHV